MKDSKEEKENWENVQYRMDAEGFDYCFLNYSDFLEINDEKFHELREAYCKIATELREYIDNKTEEYE